MKFRIIILMLNLFVSAGITAQKNYTIKEDLQGLTFKEFTRKTEPLLNVRFFYKEEWVTDLKVGNYRDCHDLACILGNLFRGTSLHFLIEESGNIIITENFAVKVPYEPVNKNDVFLPSESYPENGGMQNNEGNAPVSTGNPAEKNYAENATISGYIKNKDTGEPVSGVTVYIQKLSSGTISNDYGFYSLTIPRGNYLMKFSFIGMKEKTINLNLFGSGELNIDMTSVLIPLKEAVISAQKNLTLQRFEVGIEKINIASLRLIPSSLGEPDIIKSILMIPGVQSVGEGSAGFNVRGGSPDQNLILLYGAPVYNASHFFGFFSSVNSDIVKDITLYKGGIPCRYGGRVSSVLDIGTREGNRKAFKGNAGISPITTQISAEGPVIEDTLTYILAARTTYSSWILDLIKNPMLRNSSASFNDLNGTITYDYNKNNKLDFSAYFSNDAFRLGSDTTYGYNNIIFAARWRHFFNSRFFYSLSLNNSSCKYEISGHSPVNEAFVLSHKINSTGLKSDFNWFSGRNEVNFGLDLNRYAVNPGSYSPWGDSSLVQIQKLDKERALEGALYIEEKITITDFLSMNAGIRMSSFFCFGPKNVLIYNPRATRTVSGITDTLVYSPGQVIRKYGGPEFRISLNFRISGRSSVRLNYNRTRQYLHLLSNSASISPTDVWKLSDYYLKPQIGDQVAAGFYMVFNNTFEASSEIYLKRISNIIDFKGGTDFLMERNIERDLINMKGKAYGLEIILKKTEGKMRYELGYTYARTLIRSISGFKEEMINSGKWFPANFDKPHDLTLILNYIFTRRYSLSANYTWSTGRPVTFPLTVYTLFDQSLIHYSDRNRYRLPDYSRFDVSFRINGNLKQQRIGHPAWTFSVYNLTGRKNIYSVYFLQRGDMIKGYSLSVFARAIPTVTFSFDF